MQENKPQENIGAESGAQHESGASHDGAAGYESGEYVTFHVTARDGRDVEMAVVDEFDIENRHYVVGCVVEDDVVQTEGQYIYRCHISGDDFTVEPIADPKEFD